MIRKASEATETEYVSEAVGLPSEIAEWVSEASERASEVLVIHTLLKRNVKKKLGNFSSVDSTEERFLNLFSTFLFKRVKCRTMGHHFPRNDPPYREYFHLKVKTSIKNGDVILLAEGRVQ